MSELPHGILKRNGQYHERRYSLFARRMRMMLTLRGK